MQIYQIAMYYIEYTAYDKGRMPFGLCNPSNLKGFIRNFDWFDMCVCTTVNYKLKYVQTNSEKNLRPRFFHSSFRLVSN